MPKIKDLIARLDAVIRNQATGVLDLEYLELEHIFGLLILGQFVGLPAPPPHITLDLLPVMEKHLILLSNRTGIARGPLSELFSVLEVR
jgi:hypothetical protein